MLQNIVVFTGENEFELYNALLHWIGEFSKKYGAENITRCTAQGTSFTSFLDDISTLPLFSERRMVVVDGFICKDVEQCEQMISAIHDQVIVVFTEPTLDKRLKTTKYIQENLTIKSYENLPDKQFSSWLQKQAQIYGSSISPENAVFMVQYIGKNQRLLDTELQKLALLFPSIDVSIITQYCIPNAEAVVWNMIESIAKGDLFATLSLLESLYAHGESVMSVWATYIWMIDQLQRVILAEKEQQSVFGVLMKNYGVKFGPAKSFISLAKRYVLKNSHVCTTALRYDIALKSGGIHVTDQNQVELQSVIDQLTTQLCNLSKAS